MSDDKQPIKRVKVFDPLQDRKGMLSKSVYEILFEYPNLSEIWSLRFGLVFPGLATVFTYQMLIDKLRKNTKIGLKQFQAGKLMIHLFPALTMGLISFGGQLYIVKNLILQTIPCPVCVDVRAVTLQLITGVITPGLLAPIATNANLKIHHVKVPDLFTKEGLEWYRKMLRKSKGILSGAAILQILLISFQLNFQHEQAPIITRKMQEHISWKEPR